MLRPGERLDYVNDNLSLIQKTNGLTFGTDALLLSGYIRKKYSFGAELGSGSGIISLLALTRSKLVSCDCFEVQKDYAELTARNARLNNLDNRLTAIFQDVRDYSGGEKYDMVYTNPPYMKSTTGRANNISAKNIARHEIMGTIDDFISAASKMLRWGGDFYAVYRPDRLNDILFSMREGGIEPKRMTMVHANTKSIPSMVLIEGKRGGKSGMLITPPLIIYDSCENISYSAEMMYIMDTGNFPDEF